MVTLPAFFLDDLLAASTSVWNPLSKIWTVLRELWKAATTFLTLADYVVFEFYFAFLSFCDSDPCASGAGCRGWWFLRGLHSTHHMHRVSPQNNSSPVRLIWPSDPQPLKDEVTCYAVDHAKQLCVRMNAIKDHRDTLNWRFIHLSRTLSWTTMV